VRTDVTVHGSSTVETRTAAGAEHGAAELIAELASAGLVSVEVSDDGDITYALTPQGQQSARLMAMSRQAHALVLLGALAGASGNPD